MPLHFRCRYCTFNPLHLFNNLSPYFADYILHLSQSQTLMSLHFPSSKSFKYLTQPWSRSGNIDVTVDRADGDFFIGKLNANCSGHPTIQPDLLLMVVCDVILHQHLYFGYLNRRPMQLFYWRPSQHGLTMLL